MSERSEFTISEQVTRIPVRGAGPYEVVVGHGLAEQLAVILGPAVAQVALICPAPLRELARPVEAALLRAGYRVREIAIPDGEAAKTSAVAEQCWAALGEANFTRSDALVSFGGGATTDLAGFVAATWLRGVRIVHVPTTLLAMVDAAVGGKTGINTAAGKNLVGSFHSPAGVLVDLDLLASLPDPEWVSGLAEVVKAGFIADPQILELIESDLAGAAHAAGPHTRELIVRSIAVKAAVVSVDPTETGSGGLHPANGSAVPDGGIGREMLNYGHTLGHAIERVEAYSWRHGDAVAVGMVFVAELAALQGRIGTDLVARHRSALGGVGLPTAYRGDRWEDLHDAMRIDKKSRADRLRFVVLDGIGSPAIAESPDTADLVEAFKRVSV